MIKENNLGIIKKWIFSHEQNNTPFEFVLIEEKTEGLYEIVVFSKWFTNFRNSELIKTFFNEFEALDEDKTIFTWLVGISIVYPNEFEFRKNVWKTKELDSFYNSRYVDEHFNENEYMVVYKKSNNIDFSSNELKNVGIDFENQIVVINSNDDIEFYRFSDFETDDEDRLSIFLNTLLKKLKNIKTTD